VGGALDRRFALGARLFALLGGGAALATASGWKSSIDSKRSGTSSTGGAYASSSWTRITGRRLWRGE